MDLVVVDPLYEENPELVSRWNAFRDARAKCRAAEWLADNSLVAADPAGRCLGEHPDPDVP